MSTTKVELILVRVALALIAASIGCIGFLIFQPTPQVLVKTPIPISDKTVSNGDGVDLTVDYCADDDIVRQKIEVQLLDNEDLAYTLFSVDNYKLHKGCHSETVKVSSVRLNTFAIDNGEYRLRILSTAKVNIIKTDTIIRDSEVFTYTKHESQ